MFRSLTILFLLVTVACFTGCRLGHTPFDNAGATFANVGDNHKNHPFYRAGSVLTGSGRMVSSHHLTHFHDDEWAAHGNHDCVECATPHHSPRQIHPASPQLAPANPNQHQQDWVATATGSGPRPQIRSPQVHNGPPVITLEELRRSDPSIVDVQIIDNGTGDSQWQQRR